MIIVISDLVCDLPVTAHQQQTFAYCTVIPQLVATWQPAIIPVYTNQF